MWSPPCRPCRAEIGEQEINRDGRTKGDEDGGKEAGSIQHDGGREVVLVEANSSAVLGERSRGRVEGNLCADAELLAANGGGELEQRGRMQADAGADCRVAVKPLNLQLK